MPSPEAPSPAGEYQRRLAAHRDTLATLERNDLLVSRLRLATFGLAIALGILAWRDLAGPLTLVPPGGIFLALVVWHDRVLRRLSIARRAIAFYEHGLARLEDRWAGHGETGDRFSDDGHLYARDLDLFGRGSLFELLSVARTGAGEQILAGWLRSPADRNEVLARQEAVRELTPALSLRERLAVAGSDVRAGVDPDALIAWAESPAQLSPPALRVVAMVTTAAAVAAATAFFLGGPFLPFVVALTVQFMMLAVQGRQVEHVLHSSDLPARELGVLLQVLVLLERERFSSLRLTAVLDQIGSTTRPASAAIGRLTMLLEMHDWLHNMLFAPIGAYLLWGTHIAWAIERWRVTHGGHVRRWVDAAGQFEAFSSLATYRYEHPDDPFPEILEPQSTIQDQRSTIATSGSHVASLEASGLAHPLLPASQMVANDVSLAGDVRLLVVSGSNMSGKSTLLRTVGINVVLALAGAPVRASSLRLTPLTLGATLRIQDSLQEGRSRFYAEITRIREISDAADGPVPLLFLLDELFHGTNSQDRLVGAAGVLRSLVDRGAIGLITTHDLALTGVADALAPRAANVHFDDTFDGAEIRFDYRMKPGPVTRSNAVALMRAVGLDIPSA